MVIFHSYVTVYQRVNHRITRPRRASKRGDLHNDSFNRHRHADSCSSQIPAAFVKDVGGII